jgi:8-oxo-dGTP pyrophosphatase MutT (NUDIX family)
MLVTVLCFSVSHFHSVRVCVEVFPGGNYDAKQDDSFPSTAVRETFEETGLLITEPSPSNLPDQVVNEARQAILSNRMPFRAFLDEHRLKIHEKSLLPFTQWITPVTSPK